MSFTKISSTNIANGAVTFAQTAAGAFTLIPTITNVQIADASYNVLDDTAANTGGGFVVITGSNFGSSSQVIIGTTNATSTTYVNSTTIRAQVPAASAATYTLYVVDTVTGATAIKVNGLTYSSFPAWGTGASLSNQNANTSFGVNLSATSDSNITYANTSTLPSGTTLAANGFFSGTVSIGEQTTYSFDVKATDAENQDASRTFSLTITVTPLTRLYSWGINGQGQLGLNNTVNSSSPVQIGTNTIWSSTGSSRQSNLAVTTDGKLWSWGKNDVGQLGTNDGVYRSSPTQVGTLTTWLNVFSSQYNTSFAIRTDGTLWAWGKNNYGQLGQNDQSDRISPNQVGTGTTWLSVSGGYYHTLATKTDGTLWSWGRNNSGQLGINTTVGIGRSSPVQVTADNNWSAVVAGKYFSVATRTNGTLWTWGIGVDGQLGLNNLPNRSSPTQVGTNTNWSKISAGYLHVAATKTDGTLWTWGANENGQLGDNNTSSRRSSPTQIGSSTNWSKVYSSFSMSHAIKTDNTLWLWGHNQYGQGGINTTSTVYSPVQMGSNTNWSSLSTGGWTVLAITAN